MKFSIVRYWGGSVNDLGNLSIAGHNNYDGTMFGKTKKLEVSKDGMIELDEIKSIDSIVIKVNGKNVFNPKNHLKEQSGKTGFLLIK